MELISGTPLSLTSTPVTHALTESRFSDLTLYFLAFDHTGGAASLEDKQAARRDREGILELIHNHGTESDPAFTGYASGNTDPGRGFGHIAISVPDIEQACARLEGLGVPFKKRLTDGKMRNIAFALDPDGCVLVIVCGSPVG